MEGFLELFSDGRLGLRKILFFGAMRLDVCKEVRLLEWAPARLLAATGAVAED